MDVLGDSGLECAKGNATCGGDRDKCAKKAGHYMGDHWDTCPMRAIQDDEELLRVIALDRDSKLSAITGWPMDFVAWVPALWAQYKSKCNERDEARYKNVGKT